MNDIIKASLIEVAGDMAVTIAKSGSLPVTIDELARSFEMAYGKLQSIVVDQDYHGAKGRHVETK